MSRLRDITLPVIFVSTSVYAVSSFVLDRYWLGCVNGASMKPTLNAEWGAYSRNASPLSSIRDWIVIKRVRNHKQELKIGDIIVFVSPEDPRTTAVKRVRALPGQIYQPTRLNSDGYVQTTKHIPKGHVWVEGDNSASSIDSNNYGPIPMGLVQGKAQCVLFPNFRWL